MSFDGLTNLSSRTCKWLMILATEKAVVLLISSERPSDNHRSKSLETGQGGILDIKLRLLMTIQEDKKSKKNLVDHRIRVKHIQRNNSH